MGSMRIDLCNTDGTLVATLARRVSPVSRRHLVHIPQNLTLSTTAPEFVVQFISAYPILTIWTADFQILSLITDSVLPYSDPTPDDLLTLVLPTTTLVTTLTPAAVVPAATTVIAEPLPDDGGAGAGLNRVYQPSNAKPGKDSSRVVFIAWPALVGISMSL
ncbi:hypothetical protein MSAN_02472700 [Mycena sanguinolenta]|nr:hypothetical protein MSAN_02472700 [Mycena sanguinolenta]